MKRGLNNVLLPRCQQYCSALLHAIQAQQFNGNFTGKIVVNGRY